MKSLSLFLGGFALLVTGSAFAAAVEFTGTPTDYQGVPLYPEMKVATDNGPVTLKLNGKGVRRKFGVISVYVAASYFADPAQFCTQSKSGLLPAVGAEKVKVLQLTMLRAMDAKTLRSSFESALADYNGVDVKSPKVAAILDGFAMDLPKGASALIVGTPGKNGDEKLVIEALGKHVEQEAPGLALDLFRIWFGKGESAVLTLQKALVGC